MSYNVEEQEITKLDDEEKSRLIRFYRKHDLLWRMDNQFYRNKEKRYQTKRELVDNFNGKFSIHTLEKCFHSLRTCQLREIKKIQHGVHIKRKWKFFDELSFLQENNGVGRNKVMLESFEKSLLIQFYKNNPLLWNPNHPNFTNDNVRNKLLSQFAIDLGDKMDTEELKMEWHSLYQIFKREKEKILKSRQCGSATVSNWSFFTEMDFLNKLNDELTIDSVTFTENILNYNNLTSHDYYSTNGSSNSKKRKTSQGLDDIQIKEESNRSISPDLVDVNHHFYENTNQSKFLEPFVTENAHIFGKMVSSNLLQYDPKYWSMLKKKIMEVFVDFEENNAGAFRQSMLGVDIPETNLYSPSEENYSDN
uniref:Homeobox protein cutlike [Musca domestica] n=1 Tax=Lepeophtheirus salmonis TaxID=72036 RepID=A0A0K2UQC6_LEPSM